VNRSIPATYGISDAPDLTMPAGIYDDGPVLVPQKKPGFGQRMARILYGNEDQILTERQNIERYSKKNKGRHIHDTHHTIGGGPTEFPLEEHRHEYHMVNPAVNRNDKPHFQVTPLAQQEFFKQTGPVLVQGNKVHYKKEKIPKE